MSNFMDKFKYFIGIDEYEEEEIKEIEEEKYDVTPVNKTKRNTKLVSINQNTNLKIVVHEPLSYEEAPSIIDDLKMRKAVVVNFEQLDINLKRQIFDFINGGLYAIEGKIQKVTKDIFILAPINVEIDGIKDELKNRGIFPW
ncbi:MAG TPA: cell division protein SepF [Soehngenia sp.]|nr:cell division protein SepF [Soehngenia sp.]HPP31336.1 cell division protein SepF [Soehngenia sp.]